MLFDDVERDVDAAQSFMDSMAGRSKYDALKIVASMVAAIYTDGEPIRNSPPEKMERLLARICAAGRFFQAEIQSDPVLEFKPAD